MTNAKKYFYDVESFPNLFTVSFLSEDDELLQFALGVGHNDRQELLDFLSNELLLVGFNNISYDNAVLRFIQSNESTNFPKEIFELSKRLISDDHRRDEDILKLRYPRDVFYAWDSLDLLKIMAFDRMGVSLKQVAINLKHELIQDLPYAYNYKIKNESEVQNVLSYNHNDVKITRKLYNAILPQIQLRDEIGKLYHVDVRNASDSKMGNVVLEHFYRTELGIDPRTLRDLRTKRYSVELEKCIPSVISFETDLLNNLKTKIENTTVYADNKFKFEEQVKINRTYYSIGSGGIHSMEGACRFDTTAENKIVSLDIASMYPSCIIINNIYPKHLGEEFVKVVTMLTSERLLAKKKNKVKAEGLKISINGLYGKLNSDTFWLEDAEAMLKVTIAGQLYILMLIEQLELNGIPCISANTDGIECNLPVEKESLYYSVCKEWEKKTGFTLEYIEYKSYIKRDVNNYIAIAKDGKVKTKGAFIPEIDLKKGYKHPIVPKAVYEYFVNGTLVEKTISKCKDIFEFCISQKMGKEFQAELHTLDGIELLQKTNRFYISNHGGALQKRKGLSRSKTGLFVGKTVRLLNDYDPEVSFEEYDVNVNWYIREAQSIIDEIEPKQISMFGEDIDYGTKPVRLQTPKTNLAPKVKVPKEKDIREASKTRRTFNVSAKYMLVEKLDTKFAPRLEMYSLEKGTGKHILKIKKSVFEKKPVRIGDVLLLGDIRKEPKTVKGENGFVKVEGEWVWWIYDYDIVSDFKDFRYKEHVNDN